MLNISDLSGRITRIDLSATQCGDPDHGIWTARMKIWRFQGGTEEYLFEQMREFAAGVGMGLVNPGVALQGVSERLDDSHYLYIAPLATRTTSRGAHPWPVMVGHKGLQARVAATLLFRFGDCVSWPIIISADADDKCLETVDIEAPATSMFGDDFLGISSRGTIVLISQEEQVTA